MNGTAKPPTVAQLYAEARRLEIPGRSAMRKAELIAAIEAHTAPAPEPAPKAFPSDGSPLVADAGNHQVWLIPTVDGGWTLNVRTGGHTHDELSQGFPSEIKARNIARDYTRRLRDGVNVHELIGERQGRQAAILIETEQVMADAARNIATETTAVPVSRLDQLTQAFRDVRTTRSQVFRKPLTPAQQRIVNAHPSGVIPCGRGTGISPASLRALHDKVGGEFIRHDTVRHRIVGLRLPQAA